ncbi:tetratricopeptide repeat protein [Roseiconus lacunae]|uniref:Tetratricopeptide repeat protein n=1 Tax=Roseiconus lacunae TaxID=2605694 RepID=A0ABT7PNM3_9BACT|nr:tetratricopeptide repeat protein [Roseiconus lacunae]MDM4018105.1 tetratricopeptide repeat protein [Roseiconus lacunae]
MKAVVLLSAMTCFGFPCITVAQAVPADSIKDGYYDLGGFHYKVSTDSADAQKWFDRGLALCIAFNHEEGARCFERAIEYDPAMAMAYWGMAYAWGPNINNTEIEPHQIAEANLAIRLAQLHSTDSTPLEKAIITASASRYAAPVPEDYEPLNRAYSNAMRDVYANHTDDPLVASLFAESLMILRPWKQWDADGTPAPETPEIVNVLEKALETTPNFAAVNHLYIHTMEASPTPQKALDAANRLRNLMPGAGHLVHMPSHIDVLLGNYESVVQTNLRAIEIDKAVLERQGSMNFYTFYRIHNYHFVVYGAMFQGQSKIAMKAAEDLVAQVPDQLLRTQTDFLDAFMPMKFHVLIRFGRWEDILTEPEPADYLPMSRSVRHYARALAYAATDRIDDAEVEQALLSDTRAQVPETSVLFNNRSRDILEVAEAMVAGEIAYRKGNFDEAFRQLRNAVKLDDAMNYDEPWGWMQPARHALGALLIEQRHYEQAEQVFRADLKKHPRNPWSLNGLAECLMELERNDEATTIRNQFLSAAKQADVTIDRSCFCRLE